MDATEEIYFEQEDICFQIKFYFYIEDASFSYSYGSINGVESGADVIYKGYYLYEEDLNEEELEYVKNYLEKDNEHENLFYQFCDDYNSNVSKEMRSGGDGYDY